MILPKITGTLPGPFSLLGDPKIADRGITHDISLAALGVSPVQPSRTRFLVYAPRYAYAPAEIVPIFCAAEKREKLDCIVIHDARTLEQLRIVELPADTFSGDASCKASGAGGCDYPKVLDLDTTGLPPGLLIINLVTAAGRLSQPLLLLLRLPVTEKGPRVALMHPSFTWQAYNAEGGASFYTAAPPRPLFSVSLRRPIDQRAVNDHHNARSCLPFMRLFDDAQMPTRHFCSHDLHDDGRFLDGVEVLVLCGHDEYWTSEIRANVDTFIQRGGRVACFSGNTNWWQTKLIGEALHLSQESKEAPEPEFSGTGYMFTSWIDNPIERKLGLGYLPGGYSVRYYHTEKQAEARGISPEDYGTSRGITVVDARHPIFADTGLQAGDVFGASSDLMHVEIDAAFLRADGRLDRTRWKFTPHNLKVLGRSLIFTASFPSMNFAPEGLFHVAAVLAEVPGTRNRGAVVHAGSVGWYRPISLGDPAASRIALNIVRYLLEAAPASNGPDNAANDRSAVPATPPPGNADIDRRSMLAGAGALTAAVAFASPYSTWPVRAQDRLRPALRTLTEWSELRKRAASGDADAMTVLATRLLAEESIGAETCAQIYAILDSATQRGNKAALTQRYLLANERFDGLHPFSAEIAELEEKLRAAGSGLPEAAAMVRALRADDEKAGELARRQLAGQSKPDELSRALLALEYIAPSKAAPDFEAAASLVGPSPTTPLGLAIQGQFLAAVGRSREAELAFRRSVAGGYRPARFLSARLRAKVTGSKHEQRAALEELQAIGLAGSLEALLTGLELAVQQAQSLDDLAAFHPGLKALADKGYGNAAYLVGLMFGAGIGTSGDPVEAIKYMERCAVTKHRSAEFQLGVWNFQGAGMAANKPVAANLFERAAKQGEPRAMYNFGLMQATGDGIPQDEASGRQWLAKASAASTAAARDWLRMIP